MSSCAKAQRKICDCECNLRKLLIKVDCEWSGIDDVDRTKIFFFLGDVVELVIVYSDVT